MCDVTNKEVLLSSCKHDSWKYDLVNILLNHKILIMAVCPLAYLPANLSFLSINPSVCLCHYVLPSVYLYVFIPTSLSVCHYVLPCVFISTSLSNLTVCLSIYYCVHLFVSPYIYLSVLQSNCLSICLFRNLTAYLSVSLTVTQPILLSVCQPFSSSIPLVSLSPFHFFHLSVCM